MNNDRYMKPIAKPVVRPAIKPLIKGQEPVVESAPPVAPARNTPQAPLANNRPNSAVTRAPAPLVPQQNKRGITPNNVPTFNNPKPTHQLFKQTEESYQRHVRRMAAEAAEKQSTKGINGKMIDDTETDLKAKGDKGQNSEMIDQTDKGDSATQKDSEMMDDSASDPTTAKAAAPVAAPDKTAADTAKAATEKAAADKAAVPAAAPAPAAAAPAAPAPEKSKDDTKKSKGDKSSAATDSSGADSSSEVRSPTSTDVRSPTSTDVRSPTKTSTSTDAYTARNITVTGGAGDGDTIVTVHSAHKDEKDVPNSGGDHEESV